MQDVLERPKTLAPVNPARATDTDDRSGNADGIRDADGAYADLVRGDHLVLSQPHRLVVRVIRGALLSHRQAARREHGVDVRPRVTQRVGGDEAAIREHPDSALAYVVDADLLLGTLP